jgi:signal transduction histidine kinase
MIRAIIFCAAFAAATGSASTSFAQPASNGTAAEARAMLDRAIIAVKDDKAKALNMFNKGEGGFKDRDLQPFCFNIGDGAIVAATAPSLLGKDIRTLKDQTGKVFGPELYEGGKKQGQISEVHYVFPKPGETASVPKVSFVTGVADLGCGVGYFP